jgi:hypothetical protein
MSISNSVVTISAFRAAEHPQLCERYLAEHRKVLEDFGVLQVVKESDPWQLSNDVVLVAEHSELGLIGGIRIQRRTSARPLPLEKAIANIDPKITSAIDVYDEDDCGEICGLWNAHRFAGHGIPQLLSLAAISVANQTGIRTLFCFVAHYTLRHALKGGFIIMEQFGEGGALNYPIPQIKSFPMVIPDTILLEAAPAQYRQKLISLRCRPVQERIESPTGIPYGVRYQLLLGSAQFDPGIYSEIEREYQVQRA